MTRAVLACAALAALALSFAACSSTAEGIQSDFRKVTQTVLPSIVKIDVVEIVKEQAGREGKPLFDDLDDSEDRKPDPEFRQESLGSGIIVRRDGGALYALTNAHVISDAKDITVTLDDGRVFPAKLVGKDERKDLALVSFDGGDAAIPVARLGDSDALRVGDWVLAMGAPYGFQSTVTAGIVSALHRRGGPGNNINDFIQTDASINKGNSGGALVDIHGQVVGVNTWISSQTGDSVGLGFSIPINNIKRAIADFVAVGKIRYGWLGVSVVDADEETLKSLGAELRRAALVGSVYDDSPAYAAGLRCGDAVLAVNGKPIAGADDLIQAVSELPVDGKARFDFVRDGRRMSCEPLIRQREDDEALARRSGQIWPGFSLYPLSPGLNKELGVDESLKGLVVRQVIAQSQAFRSGIKNRDLVTAVGGKPVATLREAYGLLAAADHAKPLAIRVTRDGKQLDIELGTSNERQGAKP